VEKEFNTMGKKKALQSQNHGGLVRKKTVTRHRECSWTRCQRTGEKREKLKETIAAMTVLLVEKMVASAEEVIRMNTTDEIYSEKRSGLGEKKGEAKNKDREEARESPTQPPYVREKDRSS